MTLLELISFAFMFRLLRLRKFISTLFPVFSQIRKNTSIQSFLNYIRHLTKHCYVPELTYDWLLSNVRDGQYCRLTYGHFRREDNIIGAILVGTTVS